MKDLPEDYWAKERQEERKPIELYVVVTTGIVWYLTSHDRQIIYEGETFIPANISRGRIEYNQELKTNTLDITLSTTSTQVLDLIVQGPFQPVMIWVVRIFGDQDPYEGVMVFAGKVIGISFRGISMTVTCSNQVNVFRKKFPPFKYQAHCNHFLFSRSNGYSKVACNLSKENYMLNCNATGVTNDGVTLIVPLAANKEDGYYDGGMMKWGNQWRMILSHVGETLIIYYPFITLIDAEPFGAGAYVQIYPGCDGSVDACVHKFDNLANYFGFPSIPVNNPVWTDLSTLG